MAGVALGVLALVVVTSVFNGFEGELERVISGMNGEVVLYSRGEPISDPQKVLSKIEKTIPELKAMTASFITELMVSGPLGVAGGVLEGIDFATSPLVTSVSTRLISGRLPQADNEVALGSEIAERLGAQEKDDVRLVFPGLEGLGEPRVVQAKVVGIIRMGMYDYDSKFVFTTLSGAQLALSQPGKITSIKLKLVPGSDALRVAARLTENFGFPFRAKSWSELNKNLFYAIRLQKVVISIILAAIVLVAAFNVVSTLMMMIHDKTTEIAILKAMGFSARQAFALFCLIGLGIGVTGTALGISLGLGINQFLSQTTWIHLPSDIYYISFLPIVVHWNEVGWIALFSLLITFSATVYPALQVSLRSPLEGLRYE